jgi:hypothetical protein
MTLRNTSVILTDGSQSVAEVVQTVIEIIKCTLGTIPSGAGVFYLTADASTSVVDVSERVVGTACLIIPWIQLVKNCFETTSGVVRSVMEPIVSTSIENRPHLPVEFTLLPGAFLNASLRRISITRANAPAGSV